MHQPQPIQVLWDTNASKNESQNSRQELFTNRSEIDRTMTAPDGLNITTHHQELQR